jgi:hypothetical protein
MSLSREEQMEQEFQDLQGLIRRAQLRGAPNGDQRCDNCRFYVGEYKKIAYCNEPRLEILVGDDWWCQWWEAKPAQPA